MAAWWASEPGANIGIATEASQLVVLDVDPRHDGDESFRRLERALGEPLNTAHVKTGGGGGNHYLFEANGIPVKSRGLPGYPGIDIKARGGCVVAAGSLHASGHRYTSNGSSVPKPIPAALQALLTREPDRPGGAKVTPAPCQPSGGKPGGDFNARGDWDGPGCCRRTTGRSTA